MSADNIDPTDVFAPPRPLESVAGDSPVDVAVPFWITACVRLQPPKRRNGSVVDSAADKVLTAVQVLLADRIKSTGDAAVVLDRTKVARWCGYDSPKKAAWLFDYLASIGFLVVEQRYVKGRRGRAVDTFIVFTQPPAGYAGPRTYAELDRALADPTFPKTLFVAVPKNRRAAFRDPSGHQDLDLGAQMGTKTNKTAGQGLGSQMGTKTSDLGAQMGTKTNKTAGQGLGSQMGTFLKEGEREGTSLSGGSLPRSIEGGTADGGPSSTPAPAPEVPPVDLECDRVARSLPWSKRGLMPTELELVRLATQMTAALTRHGYTLAEVSEHALRALADPRGRGVGYVVGAFSQDRLPARLLPAAFDLPTAPDNGDDSGSDVDATPAAVSAFPACATCEAREGEGPAFRTIEGPDGRNQPCPKCRPAAA